ncbi:threonine-phosphate decarboxylase CobD [Paracoccus homiensis]|uniref:threonine-phosphate decarboxylase CobD n=1 Tax=Paracoccus homiensis TaxID=364199 RepID=UPI00398C9406
MQRDHGGDIDRARAIFGAGDWIDLSTGINRRPWPVPVLTPEAWTALPTRAAEEKLQQVAATWFRCDPARVLPMAGASVPIQLLPQILPTGRAAVLTPSYNEHAASLRAAGWQVGDAAGIDQMAGADLAVVVNPNNPDGREWQPQALADLARQVGHLIVDESFADPRPDLSLAPTAPDNVLILRSFGKFWGLAGVRLGFLIAAPDLIARCRAAMPPWSVSGTALEIGTRAMADLDWADAATVYHAEAGLRLDRLASLAGWHPVGGTHLFRLYDTPDAKAAQDQLAAAHVWSRIFPYSDSWVRLGVPGTRAEWDRIEQIIR